MHINRQHVHLASYRSRLRVGGHSIRSGGLDGRSAGHGLRRAARRSRLAGPESRVLDTRRNARWLPDQSKWARSGGGSCPRVGRDRPSHWPSHCDWAVDGLVGGLSGGQRAAGRSGRPRVRQLRRRQHAALAPRRHRTLPVQYACLPICLLPVPHTFRSSLTHFRSLFVVYLYCTVLMYSKTDSERGGQRGR